MSTLTTGENAIWSRDAVVFKIGCTSSEIKPYKRTIEFKMGVGVEINVIWKSLPIERYSAVIMTNDGKDLAPLISVQIDT